MEVFAGVVMGPATNSITLSWTSLGPVRRTATVLLGERTRSIQGSVLLKAKPAWIMLVILPSGGGVVKCPSVNLKKC